jgi:molybdopterin biosynthesis enzyme
MSERQNYTMTPDDFEKLISTIEAARKTSGMWLSGGQPMSSVQEAANGAWCELGRRMGFNGMTVRPGESRFQFSAVPEDGA